MPRGVVAVQAARGSSGDVVERGAANRGWSIVYVKGAYAIRRWLLGSEREFNQDTDESQ